MLFYLAEVNKTEIQPVKGGSLAGIGWNEKDLENLVAGNITTIIPESQLMVLDQEKPGKEAADIYALDKNGDLHIFELKRWKADKENLLQVLRYGQIYGQYSYEDLQDMLRKYEGSKELELATKHYEYFSESLKAKLATSDFNREQHFVVVTNGIDADTRNAIKYWQHKGLKIESLIYRVYSVGGKNILEFNPYNPEGEVIPEGEEGYFVVNTNLTWSTEDYKDMLTQHKAAAWGRPKGGIKRIKKGDTVFLYHNRVGVIAYGRTSDDYKRTTHAKKKLDEYFVPVQFDWQVDPDTAPEKAVHAREIYQKLGAQYSFHHTVFSIPEKAAKGIMELADTKKEGIA
ncbi:MAG: hypothetical protein HY673_26130 [Chloroflexi bacterium]|nr:hypothetical protein [Chloroflexota bacterium]